jgi:hypothetical protein
MIETKRFLESAEIRVRVMVSGVSTQGNSMWFAQSFLPASMATGINKELDKATCAIEAETRIPLADMLASNPDAYQSGWVNLRRCTVTGARGDSQTPQVWMQVYILPDYGSAVTKLNEEYEAEGRKIHPDFRAALCNWKVSQITEAAKDGSSAANLPLWRSEASPTIEEPPSAPAPIQAVVPPGIGPGQFFAVHGPPLVQPVKCPEGLKAGDTWQALCPTGQAINIQVPPGIKAGMAFKVQVAQVMQVKCPDDCGPGSTIQVQVQPQAPPHVMQVECPAGKKPGDMITVELPSTERMIVAIPHGAQPGKPFAIQLPMNMMQVPTQDMPPPAIPGIPATATALEAVKTVKSTPVTPPGKDTPVSPPGKGYPSTSAAQPISPKTPVAKSQDMDLLSAPVEATAPADLLTGEVSAPSATSTKPVELMDLSKEASVPQIVNSTPQQATLAVDLGALYAESAPEPQEESSGSSAVACQEENAENSDKFAALKALDGKLSETPTQPALALEAVPGASEPNESFQALQDSLITGFSDSFKPKDVDL